MEEKLARYRQIVQHKLLDYAKVKPSYGDVEVETVFDTVRDHYQIMHVGWNQERLIHACTIHIDIKGGKIWLQWNSTEREVAEDLVAAGVPKEDIVLGFQSPFMRQFTDYAVG